MVSHLCLSFLQFERTNFHFLSNYTDVTSKDTFWIGAYQSRPFQSTSFWLGNSGTIQALWNLAWDSSGHRENWILAANKTPQSKGETPGRCAATSVFRALALQESWCRYAHPWLDLAFENSSAEGRNLGGNEDPSAQTVIWSLGIMFIRKQGSVFPHHYNPSLLV